MNVTFQKILFIFCLLPAFVRANGQQDDKLLQLLRQELQYNMQELQKQELRPYYMILRVADECNIGIVSSFGATQISNDTRMRTLVPQIRIGSPELDNFKYNPLGAPRSKNPAASLVRLPLTDGADNAVREVIWNETLKRYKYACEQYEAAKTRASVSVEDEDKAPCFSEAPVVKYYEEALPAEATQIDVKAWEKRLNEISAVFKSCPALQKGSATLSFTVSRNYFVNTEGSEIVQNRRSVRIMLSASLKAEDGMELPLNLDYFAYSPDDLPDNARMIADARDMVERLLALQKAPVADPFTGPAILSGNASGVFFHEIFGHRLEGHRLKSGGQTFKKMVGQQVLPVEFQVYCDPTLRQYAGIDLNGFYLYDDEGVQARRVNNVVDGVLTEFLMSRVPLDGFPCSNGHGRTASGGDPVSRQSNLIIATKHAYTDAELREMLIAEAKKQGKEYGYFFRTVTSGFTYTGEGGSLNSFNVTPLEVYRVYVDRRPDELVRGVDMIGTPLSMFSNIAAAGDRPEVFTGSCGAESGWVPVTACSPAIYVSQVETQRRAQSRALPPILPAPTPEGTVAEQNDDLIFKAMQDEMERSRHISLPGQPQPYFLAYTLSRWKRFQVVASLGGVNYSMETPWNTNGMTQMQLGDYQHNSDVQYVGSGVGTQFPASLDYDGIRRNYWMSSDLMYRFSLQSMAKKTAFLSANPLPEELAAVPDMQRMEPVTQLQERKEPFEIDRPALEQMVQELSEIFCDYKDLYNTEVLLDGCEMDIFHLTTEGVKLKYPQGVVKIQVYAEVTANDGSKIKKGLTIHGESTSSLPTAEELKQRVKAFADNLMALKKAPLIEEYYTGPVLFEEAAASRIFTSNLLKRGRFMAERKLQPDRNNWEDRLGRKIMDSRLSVKNYTSLAEYDGTKLFGYYECDADGVTPVPEMTLVENGIFRQMLNGRIPTLKSPASTGSTRFMNNPQQPLSVTAPGTIHVQSSKSVKHDKLKKTLLKSAKEAGLEYAYIVRDFSGSASAVFRVDVKDGSETQVRATGLKIPGVDKLMDIIEVSSSETVSNYELDNVLSSIICPAGIILQDIEINRSNPKVEKAPVIVPPLMR